MSIATPTVAVPELTPGLELLGSEAAAGHCRPPSLVRRDDGQTVQLTPLLYELLELIDGRRSTPAIAEVLSERAGKLATAEDVEFLIDRKLRPLGLLRGADGSTPAATKANPLLALRCRIVVSNPEISEAIANKFAPLFRPACVGVVMAAFFAATGWLMFDFGLSHPAREALYDPTLLLAVFALTVASAAFHEVGHASACAYGGARPGVMGAGLYLLWPAFYTDVSDAYRLDRRGRLRVDLGGIYFNAVFALGAVALYWASGSEALLIVVPLQLLQMVRHLAPFVRLDGYHILADLTGVPDLFAQIRPILAGLLPWRWGQPQNKKLRPWVRFVVTAWVLIVIPMLMYTFVVLVVVLPRLAATTWDSLGFRWVALHAAYSKGDIETAGATILSMFALALPVLSITYLLSRTVRRIVRKVWQTTAGHPGRRTVAVLAGVCVLGLIASAWVPHSQRQPISGDERGTIGAPRLDRLVPVAQRSGPGTGSTADHRQAPSGVSDMSGSTHVVVAVVPINGSPSQGGAGYVSDPAWRSPLSNVRFNPPTPGDGDNFSVVVNTKDGSFQARAKFSLVFANGDTVDNSNRAYALANCTNCSTVAVAFQVVLVITDARVITPENMAVAINAACAICNTQALAMQLVATTGPLTDQIIDRILDVWEPLTQLEGRIESSLQLLREQLSRVESQILDILADEDIVVLSTSEPQEAGTSTTESPPTTDAPPADPAAPDTTTTTPADTTTTSAPPPETERSTTTTTEPVTTTSSGSP